MEDREAWIIHDGVTIAEASAAFCALFCCDLEQILQQRVESIIATEELRALARLRGKFIMQDASGREFQQQYDFLRYDGTRFWGKAISRKLGDGRYQTEIVRDYDINDHQP